MKKQQPLPNPSDDDWRLNMNLWLDQDWENPWTRQLVPKGTRINVSSIIQLTKRKRLTIPLPNATALLLNASATAFNLAKTIRDESGIDKSIRTELNFLNDKDAFDYIERMMESIVLAFTAFEAFVNETIPSDFVYSRHVHSEIILETADKTKIERYVPIDEKVTVILPEVLGCSSPKGSRCWQAYRQLKETRDRLIHMKSEDRRSTGAEVNTLWKAIFLTPAPHITVKTMVDYFVKHMAEKPGWHSKFPHNK
jgi:hypothetical protein